MPKQDVPVVPERAPLKKVVLSRNSQALELQGRAPGFVYQYFTTEADHPSYIGKKLAPHEIGDQQSGFAVVAGWEPCQSAINEKVQALEVRTDQGKPIDTTIRYGRQILCRLPAEEAAKYEAVDKARTARLKQQIYDSPETIRTPGASMTAVVSSDPNADRMTMLRQAGHPMPTG